MISSTPKSSIIVRVSVALAGIVVLGMSTMLISYWLSERAENDSLAINVAGSLRMQSYRLGLLALDDTPDAVQWLSAQQKIDETWRNPVFIPFLHDKPKISELYTRAADNWREQLLPEFDRVKQKQSSLTDQQLQILLDEHIQLLDALVQTIQQDAEQKVRSFRLVQIIALFATLLVSALVMYSLRVKVEQPLNQLTAMAKRIAQGDFSHQIPVVSQDELGVLASTFNLMSRSIANSYDHLEQQVDEKTQELQQSNNALQFLYETAKFIIEHNPQGINYDEIISRLGKTINVSDLELCLMTTEGNSPYLQIKPASEINAELCKKQNCSKCLSSRGVVEKTDGAAIYRFQLNRNERHYGLIVCRVKERKLLSPWQEQLIQSTTDQLAIGMSLKTDEDQSRRLAVLQERNAIARELHDSLAQALSYLKIQVTRLNKAIDREDKITMEDVAGELHEGLNNAYRQLRELLTTFRLKIDGSGLKAALESSIEQLRAQNSINIHFDFALSNIPLTPNEEIHLLQIIREASQNAIHHSGGKNVDIRLWQNADQAISLAIADDGVGLSVAPEKINHYGLAIMKERAKHLGGELMLSNRASGGVLVSFDFVPDFIKIRQKSGIITSDVLNGLP
ncbi:histidine kinase [Cellvibrio sp. KY-GH-1]|uniref:histidine kinase n=1 Tax=Cellvibrio sp. KY-GH-1 TaxID=2303332 RepID=UPI001CDA377B|nr:histidine kinase [Cellvibrio sp. KY-GH-1]